MNKKQKWSVAFLVLSFVFLIFSIPFKSAGYFVGSLIAVIASWVLILGIISYLIWHFGFHKRKGLFLFIFSLLFLLASTFRLATDIFEGYIVRRYLDKVEDIDTDSPPVLSGNEQQNVYLDEKNNFSIVFPDRWEVKEGMAGSVVKTVKKESFDEIAMISITIQNFDESVEDITKKSREIRIMFLEMGMTVENSGETTINGNKSVWVKGKQDMPLGGEVGVLNYTFIDDGKLYLISGVVDIVHFNKYEDAFRNSISTFRFLSTER